MGARRPVKAQFAFSRKSGRVSGVVGDYRSMASSLRVAPLSLDQDLDPQGHVARHAPFSLSFAEGGMAIATREGLRDADGKYRRVHVRSVARRVEGLSTTEITIMGGGTELLRTMAASACDHSAIIEVRGFGPKWRPRHDSNV